MEWLKNKKVLIVDDDASSVFLAKAHLKDMWINKECIFVARNWSQALEMAKKELLDIIIMDVSMPIMDWIEATKKIKTHHNGNSPKIIAYTANENCSKHEWIGIMDGIMVKPVFREPFQKMILEVLDEKLLKKS